MSENVSELVEKETVAKTKSADELTTAAPGVLTVGTSPDFAPYEFYHIDENGEPKLAGFDIALAQRIADDLGLELVVVPIDFAGILTELLGGNIDLGISGFSPTPERAEMVDFSELYYTGGQAFCVNAANKDAFASYEDFKGLSVGAQTGSIQYGLAEKNTPDANIVGLTKVTDIVMEVLNGTLDGAFIEKVVAEQYAKNYPDLYILWDVEYDQEGSAIAVNKNNPALLEAVNGVIAGALEDGSMGAYVEEAMALAADEENTYEGMLEEETE